MADKISEAEAKSILGVASYNTHNGTFRADEFLAELKGVKAIKTYRQMRDNDSTIGAVMYGVEQILRDTKLKVSPANDSDEAKAEADFVKGVLNDMDHTLDDHIAEAVHFLNYGFSWFEVIYKRREGPDSKNPKKRSKYSDGRLGIRKIASRAPWTIQKFDVDRKSGDVLGIHQNSGIMGKPIYIPVDKSVYYRTPTLNNDPSGRSILRNAYTSWVYLNRLQSIEAIAVERELNGIPVGYLPAEYLSPTATDDQKVLKETFEAVLRDTKFNEQGFILLPSDTYPDKEGPSNIKLMDFKLMASEGKRNIDINPIIGRYEHAIARSVLSEFLMLGSSNTGSYALSKSKSDLYLRALESYIQAIVDVLNKQVVEKLWEYNNLDYALMPTIEAGDVAPHDLKELGSYLRNLNGADISLADQVDIVDALLDNAELPNLNREIYSQSRERAHQSELARADYYDGPDNNVVGENSDEEEDISNNAGDS